jgi:aldose sugar dehydrogenase
MTDFATGLERPWGLAFLPEGRLLVSEKPGRVRIVESDGTLSAPIAGVPAVFYEGQAGLLDVAVSRDFATSGRIFFSYAEGDASQSRATVARAVLRNNALSEVTVIWRHDLAYRDPVHYGSRIVVADDDTLFITSSERFQFTPAQDPSNLLGKVIRITADGSAPADNPFVGAAGKRPEIWSLGHRSVQGATLHPVTRKLWTHEHGPMGGDEINQPRAGLNYGWPLVSYGLNYDGSAVGEGASSAPGLESPIYYWVPSIAPSGMAFYSGKKRAAWAGNLFVGALAGKALVRLEMKGEAVVAEERLLTELGERIRDVREGPDGDLFVLTDSTAGRIIRITPR